ncbi:hypothetical protein [Shimia sp. Alg240-R146]|uniref:hypothetical protein n=1 Tax=Shimia sp. Alg240-R146 TaxID=2993449 RepID=UPI0022E05973|nr:hypothetical protein [Shimia sp. Alg240-R146]
MKPIFAALAAVLFQALPANATSCPGIHFYPPEWPQEKKDQQAAYWLFYADPLKDPNTLLVYGSFAQTSSGPRQHDVDLRSKRDQNNTSNTAETSAVYAEFTYVNALTFTGVHLTEGEAVPINIAETTITVPIDYNYYIGHLPRVGEELVGFLTKEQAIQLDDDTPYTYRVTSAACPAYFSASPSLIELLKSCTAPQNTCRELLYGGK